MRKKQTAATVESTTRMPSHIVTQHLQSMTDPGTGGGRANGGRCWELLFASPAAARKPLGSPKQPEARLSTTWLALFNRISTLQLAGRLPVPTRYNVRDARRSIIHHILGTQHTPAPAMSDAPPDGVLMRPMSHTREHAA
jgi:hypothetical protein